MMNPSISVVMSVYNDAEFIESAIQSVLNQSLEDFEFIIIDELIIDSPPLLNSLNVVSDETCIDFNDGTISLNAFGGEPPYNYFLNGLTVSSTVTDLEPGNYVYLVVDNFGCEYTNTINIDSVDSLTLEVSQQNICPKCGGGLSLKKGKYGTFYGCSNFPKCRYTKKVS